MRLSRKAAVAFWGDSPLTIDLGANELVLVVRRRRVPQSFVQDSLQVVGHIGQGGRYPGQFYGAHSIAVDSKGNMYTGETYEGKRLQRFLYKGLGNATTSNN